jgi:hypothetical protein
MSAEDWLQVAALRRLEFLHHCIALGGWTS